MNAEVELFICMPKQVTNTKNLHKELKCVFALVSTK